MVGAFPVFKLGVLAVKQISRPIANRLKQKASYNGFFRRYVCIPSGQRKFRLCLSFFHSLSHMGYAIEIEATWLGKAYRCEETHR